MSEFNKQLCDERHKVVEKLEKQVFWFYILAITTLTAVVIDIIKG